MYRNWSRSTCNPAAQSCAWLQRKAVLCACTIVAQLGHTVGWIFWVRFQCRASVKGIGVSQPSPTRQNIWEGALGPNEVFCCFVQYSNILSQEKQFCDPASLLLFKSQKKSKLKTKLVAKDVSSSYRFLVCMCVLNS